MSRPGSPKRRHGSRRSKKGTHPNNRGTKFHPIPGGGREMDFRLARKGCLDKKRFYSRKTVRKAARDLGLRYYRCDFCGEWHLTHSKGGIDPWQR